MKINLGLLPPLLTRDADLARYACSAAAGAALGCAVPSYGLHRRPGEEPVRGAGLCQACPQMLWVSAALSAIRCRIRPCPTWSTPGPWRADSLATIYLQACVLKLCHDSEAPEASYGEVLHHGQCIMSIQRYRTAQPSRYLTLSVSRRRGWAVQELYERLTGEEKYQGVGGALQVSALPIFWTSRSVWSFTAGFSIPRPPI